ncbi:MAG: MFS transporter [Terriglobales bacterium]
MPASRALPSMPIDQIDQIRPIHRAAWLYLGFALTGVGTTLLGCVLPTLSTNWHMNDSRSGLLFAAQFSGSAFGALLVGSNFFASMLRGYILLIASAVSIGFFAGFLEVPRFFAFGLGLGLTMTATSMLIGTTYIGKRGAALSILNAYWTIGAALCPAIASLWVRRWAPTYLFLTLAVALAVVLVMILAIIVGRGAQYRESFLTVSSTELKEETGKKHLQLLLIFAALASLYVGVEVSISGWMMTYVHRMPITSKPWAAIATSCFWIALLSGRMLAPAVLRRLSEAELLNSCIVIGLASAVLLVLSHSPMMIVLSAAAAGLTLGPIFPLCIAKALAFLHDSPKTKWIFSVSGLGGAVLPWMTGKLSAHSGSLRIGLLVPVVALAAMIILNQLDRRPTLVQSQ